MVRYPFWRLYSVGVSKQFQAKAPTADTKFNVVLSAGHLLSEVSVIATLDFSLRFFSPEINFNDWILNEHVTERAGYSRSFSNGRVYDKNHNLLVAMHQQCIVRFPAKKTKAERGKKGKL